MKDKNLAAVLALFGGWFGLHRFYLGQVGLAFLYFIPILGAILGFIDAIALLTMNQETFDRKYNEEQYRTVTAREYRQTSAKPQYQNSTQQAPRNDRERRYLERQREREQRERNRRRASGNRGGYADQAAPSRTRSNPAPSQVIPGAAERKAGLRYFKDYEYDRAVIAFKRAVELNPQDVASHFNLAASYSCEEEADEAFYHLDRAVALGFMDFERIRTHDSFAFLRVQPAFERFAENGYRLAADMTEQEQQLENPIAEEEMVQLPEINDDLLDQLQRLATLKDKGLLTEVEFATQKKRLLG
ncbi:NINE protein [Lewinella sp. 4G2]|uniref:NINE protein n=1 Tax=Lewinella sp. 4G2 TaxID=1803372 RepID=UPI0007B4DDB7|nr:NINE protein [Lewinella sp. 4G2]OAV43843.1 hypothetical protein A3850_004715 [Lewinella sp. 4G2]